MIVEPTRAGYRWDEKLENSQRARRRPGVGLASAWRRAGIGLTSAWHRAGIGPLECTYTVS